MKKAKKKTVKKLRPSAEVLAKRVLKLEELLNLIGCKKSSWAQRDKELGAFFECHYDFFHHVRLGGINMSHERTEKMKEMLKVKKGLDPQFLDFIIFERQEQ